MKTGQTFFDDKNIIKLAIKELPFESRKTVVNLFDNLYETYAEIRNNYIALNNYLADNKVRVNAEEVKAIFDSLQAENDGYRFDDLYK